MAYLDHAKVIGYEDESLYEKMTDVMYKLNQNLDLNEAVALALHVGELNFKAMELLDKANTETYGKPEITSCKMTPVKGKCIVVSGHDLRDLELILQQTEGKGINVYTHGEMLPCNSYPNLKKYKHLIGNYGGPWQKQKTDFENFPGAILMTTNCIIEPKKSYLNRIFTRSSVGFPGVKHIEGEDFSAVIEAALKEKGFEEDAQKKEILIGFGRDTVLSLANVIIDAVKKGSIKHFFLVGGCDGYELERTYYTDLAKKIPKNCVILTLACGKYRFNTLDHGVIDHNGAKIPRLLDIGQCNDAYSAIQIALALSKAFNVGVNKLPLSMILSWFEQKAVAILLTLFHLGIENILIGPKLPAFITPNVLQALIKKYKVRPISTPKKDIKFCLKKK